MSGLIKLVLKKIYKIDNNKTKYKYLYKLKNQDNDGCIDLGVLSDNNIIKASFDIINLIEVGDYVNGEIVTKVSLDNIECNYIEIGYTYNRRGLRNKDIKSIVTKEQFSAMEYRLGG